VQKVMGINYEKILSSQDYFRCEHYHCTMSKGSCLANQELAQKYANTPKSRHQIFKLMGFIDRSISCLDCDQGKQIKSEIKKTTTKRKRGRIRINTGKCKRRGCTNPSKTRGLCRKHYQQVWRRERKCKRKK